MNKIKVPSNSIKQTVKKTDPPQIPFKSKGEKVKSVPRYDPKELYSNIIKHFDEKKSISKSTLQFYMNCLSKINSISSLSKEVFDPNTYFTNINKYIDYFSQTSPTKDNQLKAMLMFYKLLSIEIPKELIDIRNSMKTQLHSIETNKPKKFIHLSTREQLHEMYDMWTKNINKILEESGDIKGDMMKYLIVCCYCTMPPFRPSEWLNLKIVNDDKDHKGNYLNINTGKIIYADYKTVKSWGKIDMYLSDEVLDAIRAFYEYLDDVEGYKHLFTTDKNTIMATSNFCKFFKGIFNGCSPNDIRNLYCSTIPFDTPLEERAKIATMMKHSVSSQMLIYSKYNPNAYPDQINEDK